MKVIARLLIVLYICKVEIINTERPQNMHALRAR